MKKGKKKVSDNEDSDSDKNEKGKKWWLANQSKKANYDMNTHWNVGAKNGKTKKKNSDNDDETSSEKISKRKQKSPFDPPKNNSYQLMTVCNENKQKKVTKRKKVDIDEEETNDESDHQIIKINKKKSKDFLFTKTKKSSRIEAETESESSDSNNYVKIQQKSKTKSKNISIEKVEKIERKNRHSPIQIKTAPEFKSRNASIQNEKSPEKKLKIDFLESSDSEDQIPHENSKSRRNLISISKEKICSFYHISDYRLPNKNVFNDSTKPLNLKIIENPSHHKFNEELSDAEIRLFPNQYDAFFSIVSHHLRTETKDVKLCMKLLIAIDSVLYYDQSFDSIIKSGIVDFLPFSTPKLIILSYKILKLLFMFRPIFFQEDFVSMMKHLINIFPVELSLSLFIIYAHSFEFIENPWPILDLVIKEKEKLFKQNNDEYINDSNKEKVRKYFYNDPDVESDFVINDTDESYLSLLLFLNSNFKIYKENRLKNCRSVFIESLFDPTISKKASLAAYKAVINLYDSDFGEQISIANLFNDLKDADFENYSLQILMKMNVDLIPIKNKYILQLINSSHVNEIASFILQKMMSNSQRNEKIASILLNNSKWLKFGLPTFSHTLMIFQSCVKFGNQSLLNDIKNCEEIPFFFKAILQSNNINDIQQIPVIIQDIEFDDFKSLSEINFFDLLLEKISSFDDDDDVLIYIYLLSDLASIHYSRDYKKFIVILKKLLKNPNRKIYHESLKALGNISNYKKCAEQIQNQNVLPVAEKYCESKSDAKILKRIMSNINED